MENSSEQFTIDIKQLVAYVLKKWWVLFVCAVICGCALGSTVVGKVYSISVESKADAESKIKNAEYEIEKRYGELESIKSKNESLEASIRTYNAKIKELSSMEGDQGSIQEAIVEAMTKAETAKSDILVNEARKSVVYSDIDFYEKDIEIIKSNFVLENGYSYDEYLLRKQGQGLTYPAGKKDIAKKGILGAIIGVVLGGALVVFLYLINGKIKDKDSFKNCFGIPVLKMIYPYCGKRRCFYNRIIDNLNGYINPKKSEEDEYAVLAVKLNLLLEAGDNVLVTGLVGDEALKTTADKMAKSLDKSVKLEVISNPAENVVDAGMIKEKKIIIVGDNRKLVTRRIEALVEVLKIANSDIVGIVII